MTPTYLFVYGSLKRGFQFSHLMDKAEFIGTAETFEKFVLIKYCRYPCLIRFDEPGLKLKIPDECRGPI